MSNNDKTDIENFIKKVRNIVIKKAILYSFTVFVSWLWLVLCFSFLTIKGTLEPIIGCIMFLLFVISLIVFLVREILFYYKIIQENSEN